MSTIEIKKELHNIIENGDSSFVKSFYEIAKQLLLEGENNKKIQESESDIEEGRIHSLLEVREKVQSWTK